MVDMPTVEPIARLGLARGGVHVTGNGFQESGIDTGESARRFLAWLWGCQPTAVGLACWPVPRGTVTQLRAQATAARWQGPWALGAGSEGRGLRLVSLTGRNPDLFDTAIPGTRSSGTVAPGQAVLGGPSSQPAGKRGRVTPFRSAARIKCQEGQ